MKLLGKDLSDYDFYYNRNSKELRDMFNLHNLEVTRNRLNDQDYYWAAHGFISDGNTIQTTQTILSRVRYVFDLNYFSDEEWSLMIPHIEYGLRFNTDYESLMNNLATVINPFCESHILGHDTLMERFHLEFWQGRFSENHWANPKKNVRTNRFYE